MRTVQFIRRTLGASALMVFSAAGLQASDIRLLSGWDPGHPPNVHVVSRFIERVAERSEGAINVTMDGPEVVAPFEQLEPVQAGIYQMLFTHPAYHAGVTRAAFALDSSSDPDPERRRSVGLWDAIDEEYNRIGLKLIGITSTGEGSYQFLLRDRPHDSDQPFAGMRIRGTPPYRPIIDDFGGAMVVLSGGEMYSALDRNVVQGAAWPVVGATASRLPEVTNYYLRPAFGSGSYLMLMNLDAFNRLSEEEQEVLLSVAAELEQETISVFQDINAQEVEAMEAAGLERVTLSDEMSERMIRVFVDGFRSLAVETNEAAAQRIVDILNENDM
ncbi:MAG: TRAP transporter substrate-binding protein DctP [Pararhodobacter sp.]|nr:TRAP transporter substrate-binding protein DctP [Pararhodobacter sp.]